jgi:leucyl aminopeptidase
MEITSAKTIAPADVLVVPVVEGERGDRAPLRDIDRALGGVLSDAIASEEFSAKFGRRVQTALWPGGELARRVLFIGAGKRAELNPDRARAVAGIAARQVRGTFASVAFLLRNAAHAEAVVEGFLIGDFEPDLYRTKRNESKVTSFTVIGGDRRAVESGRILGEVTNAARTLVTEPPNELTPTVLAARAKELLEQVGVTVRTLTGRQLERFGGLRAVAKGSAEPPAFVTMAWEPARAKKAMTLGLVGKGITFDSGGLSLKTADGMTTMKSDMAGAAATICAMQAIAQLNVPLRVLACVPTTENMPSGSAVHVGDVVRHYSGKTSEVLNTDAEGRLVLADGLAWIAEQGATHIVDTATLTAAIEIALGKVTIGVMGRPDAFVDRVLRSARRAGEKAWPLPLYEDYRELIRSEIADIKNTAGRPAGSITAAWFLAEFVPDDVQWAHLDIAGVAWTEAKPYRASGATGSAVRALTRIAQDLAARA